MKPCTRDFKRACLCCGKTFESNHRSRWHQTYCSDVRCRKASKAASQRRWLEKPENARYFSGPEHLERLRAWRRVHPGYWREHKNEKSKALQIPIQDLIDTQLIEPLRTYRPLRLPIQDVMAYFSRRLLQLEQEEHRRVGRVHADQTSSGT